MSVGKIRPVCLLVLAWAISMPGAPLSACTEPVFRYAFEAWQPDPYQATVYCPEPLQEEQQAALEALRGAVSSPGAPVNLVVTTVAPNANEAPPAPAGIALKYPASAGIEGLAWSAPLDAASVAELIQSPSRQELGRRLLSGSAIVWLLLESGEGLKDNAAAEVLATALRAAETRSLEQREAGGGWEGPDESAEASYLTGMAASPSPALLLLRVSRSDPAERAFAAMLTNCAPHLSDRADEPMAFPVFGRGRVLDVLVGQEINADLIGQVNAFLSSPCSCIVQVQDPGLDLLMAVDWEAGVARVASESQVLLPLAGRLDVLADSQVAVETAYETDHPLDPPPVPSSAGGLTRNTMLALGGLALVAVAATVALPHWLRRKIR